MTFSLLLKYKFEDFSTADDVTYSFKPDGLLVSDAAKQLLLNQGWELVGTVPEDSSFEIQGSM